MNVSLILWGKPVGFSIKWSVSLLWFITSLLYIRPGKMIIHILYFAWKSCNYYIISIFCRLMPSFLCALSCKCKSLEWKRVRFFNCVVNFVDCPCTAVVQLLAVTETQLFKQVYFARDLAISIWSQVFNSCLHLHFTEGWMLLLLLAFDFWIPNLPVLEGNSTISDSLIQTSILSGIIFFQLQCLSKSHLGIGFAKTMKARGRKNSRKLQWQCQNLKVTYQQQ